MMSFKGYIGLGLLWAAPAIIMGQHFDFSLEQGITVEESYLQESVELIIIREQSRAEGRDMKLSALSNIETAIAKGIRGKELLSALEYMGLEGILNKPLNPGAIAHNYPDIRARVAACLGELGSPEAANVLIRMVNAEHEVMVLTEAVKSLNKLGINEQGKTLDAITKMFNHFNMFYPDNMLALSCLEAYEQFARNKEKLNPTAKELIFQVSEGSYHSSIRQRAKQLLIKLRTYSQGN